MPCSSAATRRDSQAAVEHPQPLGDDVGATNTDERADPAAQAVAVDIGAVLNTARRKGGGEGGNFGHRRAPWVMGEGKVQRRARMVKRPWQEINPLTQAVRNG
jgi:hypothetical protein